MLELLTSLFDFVKYSYLIPKLRFRIKLLQPNKLNNWKQLKTWKQLIFELNLVCWSVKTTQDMIKIKNLCVHDNQFVFLEIYENVSMYRKFCYFF